MKKFVLFLIFGAFFLPYIFSLAEDGPPIVASSERSTLMVSSAFYDGSWVSLDTKNINENGASRVFLSVSMIDGGNFGFAPRTLHITNVEIPERSLRFQKDGKRVFLDIDLAEMGDVVVYRRVNGGILEETDLTVFPDTRINFAWSLNEPDPSYGGKVHALYERPDHEWSREVQEQYRGSAEGSGTILGIAADAFPVERTEYTKERVQGSRSLMELRSPGITFPSPLGLPEEP